MKHRLNTDGQDGAFSLMELLVIIAVIGILWALLMQPISRVKKNALGIRCINNLHQLGIDLQGFVQANHVYPLYWNVDFSKGGYPEHHQSWDTALGHEESEQSKVGTFFTNGVWNCPAAHWNKDQPAVNTMGVWFSYGYNFLGLNSPGKNAALGLGGQMISISGPLAPPVAESEIVAPSDMMAIGDGFDGNPVLQRGSWLDAQKFSITSARHQGKGNIVFCDGHVESPKLRFLFEDTNDVSLIRWNRDHLPHREKLAP